MASNPTTMVGFGSAQVLTAAGSNSVVTLNPDREYELLHTGLDAGGNVTADEVWGTTDATTPTADQGASKFTLISGGRLRVGPGVTTLTLKASANDPLVVIMPMKTHLGQY